MVKAGEVKTRKASAVSTPKDFMLYGPPKRGKFLASDEPVLTDKGWRAIGTLAVGDRTYGTDGLLHNVTGVYPQGVQPMYRVVMDDGSSVRAGGPHLWSLSTRARPIRTEPLTTLQIMERLQLPFSHRLILPEIQPIEWENPSTLPIDPYVLGLLLGDGSLSGGSPVFTNPHEYLHDLIAERTESERKVIKVRDRHCLESRFVRSHLLENLRALDMCHLSIHKRLPELAFTMSVADRFNLLQGLMDTDGSYESSKSVFNTSSPQLCTDVIELVRGLGGKASFSTKLISKYTYKNENRIGQPSYRVYIRLLPEFGSPFRLAEKEAKWSANTSKRLPSKRIVSVSPDGESDATCIAVDAPDRLYITRDYIVTHNTTLAASIINVPKFKKVLLYDIDLGSSVIGEDFPNVDVREFKRGDIKAFEKDWAKLVADDGAGYDAVIVDTVTMLQGWKVKSLPKTDGYARWDAVKEFTLDLMWDLHEMTPVGISTFHTEMTNIMRGSEDDSYVRLAPALQGSAKVTIGGIPDVIGYIDVSEDEDDELTYFARWQPSELTISGNRFKRLPPVLATDGGMRRIYEVISNGI
jgi:hypothetical protein